MSIGGGGSPHPGFSTDYDETTKEVTLTFGNGVRYLFDYEGNILVQTKPHDDHHE